ncbi:MULTISPECIES: metal-dependent hydrolase [unclassified Coleofasciculus]|uniref:metal-dependent hydrolase n=1 Tax=unclassified Coleofasciculus TaxID=2692782 RepID=UPI00187EE4F8|nr:MULTISPECIES: metal-dependent hydrolase [unclassified Coleofasciculus]MBE9126151.1 metal-dependent hydrolase [Coleofasciculus sp. LEGE 07081]MBE9149569.1 metal-dependent hydrolase [Coleofasciculus sp. LEGE 07092]
MPSPIAHSVSGYVLAKFLPLAKSRMSRRRKWEMQIFYPVFVASVADLDFIPQLITGESFHRGLTHSLIFTLGFSAIIAIALSYWWKFSYKQLVWITLILYGSHLVLDFFTEGRGIPLFSPFTDTFFASPISLFPGVHYSRGLWHPSHLIPLVFESIYSVLVVWGVRRWQKSKFRKKIDSIKNSMN